MELRQLKYFVRAVDLGSLSRAANDLHTVSSALSQQISRLEDSLSTRLLQRTSRGVAPTAAGLEFYREAQLAIRHAEQAAAVAQNQRSMGKVGVGMAASTGAVLGKTFLSLMRERYPEVKLHVIESPTGYLSSMLNSRQIDLAILFDVDAAWRWDVTPLATEKIYLIEPLEHAPLTNGGPTVELQQLQNIPLILSSPVNGLRCTLDVAFAKAKVKPKIVMESDSLGMLMDALDLGMGATLQTLSAFARWGALARVRMTEVKGLVRVNSLCSLSDDELSMSAIGARVVLRECVREVIREERWLGVDLHAT
jgi:LysR family tcuABC transcriptional regulator